MATVADVTDASFNDLVLKSARPVLIDYWADWCAPCKQLSPIIEELARDYGDKITFLKMDTNTSTQVPTEQGVLSLPTIQIFVGGEVVKSFTGAKPKSVLLKAIDEYL